MFEIDALYLEDIVLDMRDRIVTELLKQNKHLVSDEFINEIEGKMELYVRKVNLSNNINNASPNKKAANNAAGAVISNQMNDWQWKKVNDFDRIEKFSDDEVFEDEVVFKLTKK
jgi:hypothetical protein